MAQKKHHFEGIYPERWQIFVHACVSLPDGIFHGDFTSLPDGNIQSHTIHVQNIYLHLVDFYGFHVGKYTIFHGSYGT